ncbi:MAG: NAD(P)H-hydrate dehydratase [Opitutales bacterium]|nr:NAD(P)H-hydrate dehydratase [Opitutales bacterium]
MPLLSHPIIDCAESVKVEEAILHGDEALIYDAMTRAGQGVGEAVLHDWLEVAPMPRKGLRILVLCGVGHNGGDAMQAARFILSQRGQARARVVLAFGREKLRPLAAKSLEALEEASGGRAEVAEWSEELGAELAGQSYDICIEGIVGMQMRPPLREPAPRLFDTVNGMDIALRAAVDLPAGMGDESSPEGYRADFTYATGIAKSPLFAADAVARTGRVRYLDLGFFDKAAPDAIRRVLLLRNLKALRALRPAASDKRSFGHVFVLGGSRTMPGALAMATLGAVRSGAGLVTAVVPANLSSRMAPLVPEAMWQPLPIDAQGSLIPAEMLHGLRSQLSRASCLVAGPGMEMSRDLRVALSRLVRELDLPMVLDAGAICEETANAVAARPISYPPVVFTPHMGEFMRMVGNFDDVEKALMDFTSHTRSVVLLKGSVTRICDGKNIYMDCLGGPVLARGGSGDILSGIIGSLLARRGAGALESACLGSLWHGAAGEHLARERGQEGVRTTELLDHLAPALREL